MPSMATARAALRDATATDEVRVAVVVDLGAGAPASPRVILKCLKVPAGANGSDVLASVARAFRVPAPTYATSGLLCSIDGYPASGCGTGGPGGYAYWSFWHGGRHWTYANVGPAEWTVVNGDVEGWRFQRRGSGASNPPPAAASSFAAVCAAAAASAVPRPAGGPTSSGPAALVVAGAAVLALGGAAAIRWRRRPRT